MSTRLREITVPTDDGLCPVHLHSPCERGACPGVILYMDGPGIRPAIHEIAARLADEGYAVLLPDLFYRAGRYPPVDPKVVFTDPALKEAHRARLMSSTSPTRAMTDTRAILAASGDLREVAPGPFGMVGYCMGGRLALLAAATFPDQVAATASFHGGNLANDDPASPHRLAHQIKARVYVAGAIEDANFPEAQKVRLEEALAAAGVDHRVETYPARHGWVPRDTAAHDEAEKEHHWRALTILLDAALKQR